MVSDETWDGHFSETPTTAELLARDQWLLIQLDNSDAPVVKAIVSRKNLGNLEKTLHSLILGCSKSNWSIEFLWE